MSEDIYWVVLAEFDDGAIPLRLFRFETNAKKYARKLNRGKNKPFRRAKAYSVEKDLCR